MFSESVLCVGNNNVIANAAWATKTSEVWNPMTFTHKYDITGRPVQFYWHLLWLHSAPNHETKFKRPRDFKGRNISMSMVRDIEWWTQNNLRTCLADVTEATEYANLFKLGNWCFCRSGQENVWYRSCSNKHNGAWERIVRNMIQTFEETSHPIFSGAQPFSKGDVKSKKGMQTIHHQSTTKTKDIIFRIIFGMHWVIAECDWFDWDNRIQVAHRREGPEL